MTKRITPPAGQPLTAAVEGDHLVIRIGIDALAVIAMQGETWPDDQTISNPHAFARAAADGIPSAIHAFEILEGAWGLVEFRDGDGVVSGNPVETCEDLRALTASRLPAHIEEIRGTAHRQDAKGNWVAEEVLKPQDLLADDLVRQFIAAAKERSGSLAEFRDEALAGVSSLNALLDQQYGVTFGGKKGNVTLTTIHPTMRLEVRVNELVAFGPELKQAKALIDECLSDWSTDAHPIIHALVNHAFSVEKEGRANRGALLSMLRYEVDDPRWQRAMQALKDSIRVDGTKTYVRFQERDTIEDAWRTISLDFQERDTIEDAWRTISLDIARA